MADEDDPESVAFTKLQFQRFQEAPSPSWRSGVSPPASATAATAGVINYPEMHLDMVRPGVILYGLPQRRLPRQDALSPAMSLYSTLTLVKTVAAGTTLSYGRIFTAPTRCGWAPSPSAMPMGLSGTSGKAKVLIRGKFAPGIYWVCMDQLMVDLTDIP